jgi:hypothetical protein
MAASYVVIIDADRIHQYVFSPQHLKLIRGGSAIQAELNLHSSVRLLSNAFRLRKGGCDLVYAGGGTVVALFGDAGDAQSYCDQVAGLFRKATMAASGTRTSGTCEPAGRGR